MNADPTPAHGGDVIAAVIASRGVRHVFTLVGGHVSPILVGCKRRGIAVIDVRHEVNTVFAADAIARRTGQPGVAIVTAGPGVTNTITAAKNAQMAQSPLVLIGGAAATILKGRGSLQDIEQRALFRTICKRTFAPKRVRDLARTVERAFDTAASGVPGPVFVECPIDLLYPEANARAVYLSKTSGGSFADRALRWYLRRHLDRLFARADDVRLSAPKIERPGVAASGFVSRARSALTAARRPVLVLGSQAVAQPERVGELRDAIEALGAPVYLAGGARGLLGRAHPLQAFHKRREALRGADVVLLAGVPCDFRMDYGRVIPRRTKLVSINRCGKELRLNRKPSLGAVADPAETLIAIAEGISPAAASADRTDWLAEVAGRDRTRDADILERSRVEGSAVNPLALCRQIEGALPDDSILIVDGGDFAATAAYVCRPRGPLAWLDPGPFGTLGVGAGFALGAKLASPGSEVWIIYGDGSVGFSLPEFDSFVRHGIGVIAVVGNDACWGQIARDQVDLLGDDVACPLAPTDYHEAARGLGAVGLEVRRPEELSRAIATAREAAGAGRPVLLNVHLDGSDFRKGSISV